MGSAQALAAPRARAAGGHDLNQGLLDRLPRATRISARRRWKY